jgi:hypothetical protein
VTTLKTNNEKLVKSLRKAIYRIFEYYQWCFNLDNLISYDPLARFAPKKEQVFWKHDGPKQRGKPKKKVFNSEDKIKRFFKRQKRKSEE